MGTRVLHLLPPIDTRKASGKSAAQEMNLSEVLFADDNTLIERHDEVYEGRDRVIQILHHFEERCHPDNEEHAPIREPNMRILGS